MPLTEEDIEIEAELCSDCHPSMEWMIDEDEEDFWDHEDWVE